MSDDLKSSINKNSIEKQNRPDNSSYVQLNSNQTENYLVTEQAQQYQQQSNLIQQIQLQNMLGPYGNNNNLLAQQYPTQISSGQAELMQIGQAQAQAAGFMTTGQAALSNYQNMQRLS